MRVRIRGVGDVVTQGCGSLVGEFEGGGGELGKMEGLHGFLRSWGDRYFKLEIQKRHLTYCLVPKTWP
jgi:hypothetical protein